MNGNQILFVVSKKYKLFEQAILLVFHQLMLMEDTLAISLMEEEVDYI